MSYLKLYDLWLKYLFSLNYCQIIISIEYNNNIENP